MIKLELPDQMVAIIGKALGEQPYNLVSQVILEMQRQIEAQQPKSNGKDRSLDQNEEASQHG